MLTWRKGINPHIASHYHLFLDWEPLPTAFIFCESLKQTKCTIVLPLGYTAKTLVPIFLLQREHMLSLVIFKTAFLWLYSSSFTCFIHRFTMRDNNCKTTALVNNLVVQIKYSRIIFQSSRHSLTLTQTIELQGW